MPVGRPEGGLLRRPKGLEGVCAQTLLQVLLQVLQAA
jgi:hypothetical protein